MITNNEVIGLKIKLLAMDVDGTLTDGRIFMSNDGEIMKAFDVKDGYGIVRFRKGGGIPVVITGRYSQIVENRCAELGITELHQKVDDKLSQLKKIASYYSIAREQIAYIGDDENDLECIKYAGISACPSDAVEVVRKNASYICQSAGGRGAVREFLEYINKK